MLHSVPSFFYFSSKCLFSVRLDSLCLPRGKGRGLVCTRKFSFREFYNFLLFYFLIVIFLENCFFPTTFTHSHDPHRYPRPATHDPRQRITPSLDQPSRASPDQTQSSYSRSTQSSYSRSTQSNKSRSTHSGKS